jgi:Rad3-related DNA helicase
VFAAVQQAEPGLLVRITKTVALVSATLTTTPGNFAFIRSETGIPRDALELMVPSPFDLERQCLAILPDHLPGERKVTLPDAKEKDYGEKLVPFFQYVLDQCDGRTLGRSKRVFMERRSPRRP